MDKKYPEINELSTGKIRIQFFDYDGNEFIPSSFRYSIHDVQTDSVITSVENIVPSSSVYDVLVTSQENAILNDMLPYELKCFSLEWYSGNYLMGTAEFIYRVINLRKIPL